MMSAQGLGISNNNIPDSTYLEMLVFLCVRAYALWGPDRMSFIWFTLLAIVRMSINIMRLLWVINA